LREELKNPKNEFVFLEYCRFKLKYKNLEFLEQDGKIVRVFRPKNQTYPALPHSFFKNTGALALLGQK